VDADVAKVTTKLKNLMCLWILSFCWITLQLNPRRKHKHKQCQMMSVVIFCHLDEKKSFCVNFLSWTCWGGSMAPASNLLLSNRFFHRAFCWWLCRIGSHCPQLELHCMRIIIYPSAWCAVTKLVWFYSPRCRGLGTSISRRTNGSWHFRTINASLGV